MIHFLLFYFSFLPFQWALSPAEGVDLALSRVVAMTIILSWIAVCLGKQCIKFPVNVSFFFLSLVLFLATLSYTWADQQEWATRKIIFLWTFFPLFAVFIQVLDSKEKQLKILRVFIFSAALAACVGIIQFIAQFIFGVERTFAFWVEKILPFFLGTTFGDVVAAYPSLLVNISGETILRASAFFPDPHMFSLYVGMAFPIAIALWLHARQERKKLSLVIAILLLLADLLSFSRAGYLALGGGMLLLIRRFSFFEKITPRHTFGTLIVLVVVSGTLMLSPIGNRFISSFSLADGSNTERLRLWKEAGTHIFERPLVGVGIGNYPLLVKPSASYREPIYSHNLFLDLAVEIGMIGSLAFLGFLVASFINAWSAWKRTKNAIPIALAASLVIFFIHSLFETPIYSVQVLPVLLLIAALATCYSKK